jgi:glutamate N-acetyltransferase / amino-acid N-acetyltransferase
MIPEGFLFGSSSFALRSSKSEKPDFSILFSETPCEVAFVATKNVFCGEPVKLAREIFAKQKKMHGVVVNVGSANVGTGKEGRKESEEILQLVSKKLNISPDALFPASTGVIGKRIPMEKVRQGIQKNFPKLEKNADLFAYGILTTDLVEKKTFVEIANGIRIFGVAKGSGMIAPNMATMLAFITTDADISGKMLQEIFERVIRKSFNRLSVDGDTSPSDMAFCFANGKKQIQDFEEFENALFLVCKNLAKEIAIDGEGATKLLEVRIQNAKTEHDAEVIGRSVVNSSLWKCAVFGNDPNWGRVLAAMGYSGISFSPEKVSIRLMGEMLFLQGEIQDFSKETLSKKLSETKEVMLEIDMGNGRSSAIFWGCDFSYDYVRINAEYST